VTPGADPEVEPSPRTLPTELTWRAWPFRRHPLRGLLGIGLVVGSAWGTADWTGDVRLAGLAAIILLVATGPFYVPTRYRLSADGVEIARPWRSWHRPWSHFRSVRRGGELVVLSPFTGPSWLESFRGEKLFLEGDPEGVIEYVEEMVGKEARAEAGGGGGGSLRPADGGRDEGSP
jgi:hypothetical protein